MDFFNKKEPKKSPYLYLHGGEAEAQGNWVELAAMIAAFIETTVEREDKKCPVGGSALKKMVAITIEKVARDLNLENVLKNEKPDI